MKWRITNLDRFRGRDSILELESESDWRRFLPCEEGCDGNGGGDGDEKVGGEGEMNSGEVYGELGMVSIS